VDERLAENRWQGVRTIALFDDGDDAAPDVLDAVRRISHLGPGNDARLTLIIAGRTERISLLGRRLLELADLRIDVTHWDLADTDQFIRQSLNKAGRVQPAFNADALIRLHELSDGIARRLIQLADLALLAGAARDLAEVDTPTVESVHDELGAIEVFAPADASD
jgi:general secretion pathway protein A